MTNWSDDPQEYPDWIWILADDLTPDRADEIHSPGYAASRIVDAILEHAGDILAEAVRLEPSIVPDILATLCDQADKWRKV